MFNMQLLNQQTVALDDLQQGTSLTHSQAGKIVNIAGIGTGDSVLYSGISDRAIETTVMGLGARLVAGKVNPWAAMVRNGADVALCFIPECELRETARSLRIFRRYLRPGGRMVMWTAPDRCHCLSDIRNHFLEAAGSAGFTSMIVGQLPPQEGRGIVVATGILNKGEEKHANPIGNQRTTAEIP